MVGRRGLEALRLAACDEGGALFLRAGGGGVGTAFEPAGTWTAIIWAGDAIATAPPPGPCATAQAPMTAAVIGSARGLHFDEEKKKKKKKKKNKNQKGL
jgi:hypothetical protein